jgi:hypothetical protein
MTRNQIAYAIRTRLRLPTSMRPFAVVVGVGWFGVAIKGKDYRMEPTIPSFRLGLWFALACMLTCGLAYFAWKAFAMAPIAELQDEIRSLFRRELGIR